MPTARFERPPEVAAEVAALPGEEDPDYLESLRACRLEVLVIARRRTAAAVLQARIDAILVDRTLPVLRAAVARHAGVSGDQLEDAQQEAMLKFWSEIQCESFFEIKFNLAMKTLARRAGERIRGGKQRTRERAAERIGASRGPGEEVGLEVADDEDGYSAIENRMLIEAGLATLPDEQAWALTLRYIEGQPAHSQDPQVATVSSVLGWSERKTRQLLADGKAALRIWIDQEGDND